MTLDDATTRQDERLRIERHVAQRERGLAHENRRAGSI